MTAAAVCMQASMALMVAGEDNKVLIKRILFAWGPLCFYLFLLKRHDKNATK